MTERILVTGAAGTVGTLLRPRLAQPGRVLRLLDTGPQKDPLPNEQVELVTGSVTDPEAMATACEGVDALVHLGGLSREAPWADTLAVNIDGTRTVLEAAVGAGVGRVVLASSNHSVGFRRVDEAGPEGLPSDSSPRPDTYYGVSKAAVEALGSLYHSRFGIGVVVLRIGSCFDTPLQLGSRGLSTWLSPDDGARLFEACLSHPDPGYRIVWGVSDNTRSPFSLVEARALGYEPQDDAEVFADQLEDAQTHTFVGGGFCTAPLGRANPL